MEVILEITIGNILTFFSILVGIMTFLYVRIKDINAKKKEFAETIRNSASIVLAKLERRKEISLMFYDNVMEYITQADSLALRNKNLIATRDFFWEMQVKLHFESKKEIVSEEIEIAYSKLYGYDSNIRSLFKSAINLLDDIDEKSFNKFLHDCQDDIMGLKENLEFIESSDLGNKLRHRTSKAKKDCSQFMNLVIEKFMNEILLLIQSEDSAIFAKRTRVKSPNELFASFSQSN